MRNSKLLMLIVLCLSMTDVETHGEDATRQAMQGGKITAEQAGKLEDRVKQNPKDIASRTKLLGFYFMKQFQDPSAEKTRQTHILWLIHNVPQSEVLSTPFGHLNLITEREAYLNGKRMWEEHLASTPDDLRLLENSASYFTLHDRDLAFESLKKAHALDKQNPKWPKKQGQLHNLNMMFRSGKDRAAIAGQALEQFQLAYSLAKEIERDELIVELARTAFAAGKLQKAKEYAELALKDTENGRFAGERIHHGNNILGRIALAKNHVAEAKKHLIKAGKTPGSPPLNSFGPNMQLARELLKKGETDVVLEYFQLCSGFWESGQDQLDEWSATVKAGKIPNFGANLRY